ncbi:probable inactive receptor kinase At3g02880 [Hibiscus syriacus]|uniref:probable inactive receptor kinase At3g02880 n=1 Tax=Hibiscus syriacus TaxID=106335 RepID=UPI00192078BD|nr:probable inactive receptor kinase At3g02880 [Hibiscus syriacus]
MSSGVVALIPIVGEYYPSEVEALLRLRDAVGSQNLYSNWTGIPCMNNQSQWGGVACSDGHVVRLVLDGVRLAGSLPPLVMKNLTFLTKLSMRSNSITGPLPDLSDLVHLEYVFLSRNLFNSSIPFHYVRLPNLKKIELEENYLQGEIPPFDQQSLVTFNVSYNRLQGPIPQTDVLQGFSDSSYEHNSGLCGSPIKKQCPVPPAPSPSPNHGCRKSFGARDLAFVIAVSVLVPSLVILGFLWYYRKVHRKETAKNTGMHNWFDERSPQRAADPERAAELVFFDKNIAAFDMDDLLRASAEVLGRGKLSTTYKASLEAGVVVTVKRIKDMKRLSNKEFVQQMQMLGKLKHENLVHMVSSYNSKEEKLLIYEFVPATSLFDLLHENRGSGRIPLNWGTRLSIIKDVAKAMTYLHQHLPNHKVPHANLKSSNVLIHCQGQSQNYNTRVTDYGYYPLLSSRKSLENLAISRSPEFCQGKKLTIKADVYCFGIIVLEIITGRIPVDEGDEERELGGELSEWVRDVVNNDWSTDILDVEILCTREAHDEMLKLTNLALECTAAATEERPKMSEVLRRIEEIEQRKMADLVERWSKIGQSYPIPVPKPGSSSDSSVPAVTSGSPCTTSVATGPGGGLRSSFIESYVDSTCNHSKEGSTGNVTRGVDVPSISDPGTIDSNVVLL